MWREIEEVGIVTLYDEPRLNTPFGEVCICIDNESCSYRIDKNPCDNTHSYRITPTVNASRVYPFMLECSLATKKASIGFANWPREDEPDIWIIDNDNGKLVLNDEKNGVEVTIAFNNKLYGADYEGSMASPSNKPSVEIPVGSSEYLDQANFLISWRED